MFRSATFKLTMWYIAIVMAISLAFSFVVYHLASNELAWGLNHQTQRWYSAFPGFDDDPFFSQNTELSTGRHEILMQLIYFNLIVLVGAGIASYALARLTLSPIEEAHTRQKRFTADVSHELRTPLTALRMESEVALMDSRASKDALRASLKSNIEESQKLETLINNLLRLTKLEAGQLDRHFTYLSAADLVKEATAHIQSSAKAKHIKIENNVNDLPLRGDRDSLVQLLVILLDNAIKYSPEHSTIELDGSKHQGTSRITVTDKGIGIEPAALKHVFDRFYRADKARTNSATSGFGLGLSIAKNIADLHHGSITLTSRPGKGTTATVLIPAPSKTLATKSVQV
ncbi:MAG TPA: HAMP domain-containing sensor histidine kinase [Candidatus Saccharimonadales bacterium]|nr:HAMP domain-containing sensor histidine kinase [Candidatus Saccharimonadales bacterium]